MAPAAAEIYRGLFERSPDGIIVTDGAGSIVAANPAARDLLGFTAEALLQRPMQGILVAPTDAARGAARQNDRLVEVELRTAEGTIVSAEARTITLPATEGDLCAWVLRSCAAQHLAPGAASLAETTYQSLVEHLPGVVYRLADDENQTALYLSPRLEELTGYSPAEALAQSNDWHWLDQIHPDDRARIAAEDAALGDSGEPVRLEYRLRRADGSYVWVQDEYVPVRDNAGQIVAWQGVLLDISDRIQAEEDQARLAAIVESSEDAIISRSLDGLITSWNRGAERLYGFSAEEAIGKPIAMLLAEGDDSDPLIPAEALGEQPLHFDATRQRRDGSVFAVAISISPIRDRNGVVTGVSSITRDITERQRSDEELRVALDEARAATRAKTLFLAMMSHELRTPLQAVLGYADFLLADPSGSLSPQQAEDIGFIQQGARRMVTLIDQMLDLSRMEAGRLELETERVDLAEIIEQVRQDIAPQAAAKGLTLDISIPGARPAALGDSVRIRQILLNLAGNAVKFTERGGVRIDARATEQGVAVAVSDSGIGIAPEALPHIFEEFRQVDSRTTRRYGGAGLGLAISRRLAEEMGGSISVESVPGIGSTFTLHLLAADGARRRTTRQRKTTRSRE